ncbi:MAG: hypothetical protein FJ271_14000 [Planctomycetes bacterium]|nr:hypothetical protein [Planctomycetota bacterium]
MTIGVVEKPAAPTNHESSLEEHSTMHLVELLLKDESRVDELNRVPENQRELLPRFLFIAQASYLAYSLIMLLVINLAPQDSDPDRLIRLPPAGWQDGSGLGLLLAYNLGIVLAACVCLPSFYFSSLLAGVRLTWLQIVSLIAKGTAANSIMLLGILPIYVTVVLGGVVLAAPEAELQWMIKIGLMLPFLAGLWGLRAIYEGIMDLHDVGGQPDCSKRRCFLRRLTLSWAAVYTAVLPIMIYRLWEFFALGMTT